MNDWLTALASLGLVLSPALLQLAQTARAAPSDTPAPERKCVDEEEAPVHRAFGGRNDIVARLDLGTAVHVVAKRDNWNHVIFADGEHADLGWVIDRHLEYCAAPPSSSLADEEDEEDEEDGGDDEGDHEQIVARTVSSAGELSSERPAVGTYRVHNIDVGTGLAVLVQGADFNLLFDGGSSDDNATGRGSRLIAYLYAAIGPSGGSGCIPDGDDLYDDYAGNEELTIHHVFLSHPHEDHGAMLDDVLRCYSVENVWDAGVVNDTKFYKDFVELVAGEDEVRYHTAAPVPDDRIVVVKDTEIELPTTVEWTSFTDDAEVLELGANAQFRILHADGEKHGTKYNFNSIVVRVDLGTHSLLLTGDEEAGERDHWSDGTPKVGTPEAKLLAAHAELLNVDILQVPHHGSRTSSRTDFLDAVQPTWALIGDGPELFHGIALPDPPVVKAVKESLGKGHPLSAAKRLLNTNAHDGNCPIEDRIGRDNENAGGCDNFVLEISDP